MVEFDEKQYNNPNFVQDIGQSRPSQKYVLDNLQQNNYGPTVSMVQNDKNIQSWLKSLESYHDYALSTVSYYKYNNIIANLLVDQRLREAFIKLRSEHCAFFSELARQDRATTLKNIMQSAEEIEWIASLQPEHCAFFNTLTKTKNSHMIERIIENPADKYWFENLKPEHCAFFSKLIQNHRSTVIEYIMRDSKSKWWFADLKPHHLDFISNLNKLEVISDLMKDKEILTIFNKAKAGEIDDSLYFVGEKRILFGAVGVATSAIFCLHRLPNIPPLYGIAIGAAFVISALFLIQGLSKKHLASTILDNIKGPVQQKNLIK